MPFSRFKLCKEEEERAKRRCRTAKHSGFIFATKNFFDLVNPPIRIPSKKKTKEKKKEKENIKGMIKLCTRSEAKVYKCLRHHIIVESRVVVERKKANKCRESRISPLPAKKK
jgi:hypothetical protein